MSLTYISKPEASLGDETTDNSVNRRLPFVKESSGNRPVVQCRALRQKDREDGLMPIGAALASSWSIAFDSRHAAGC